MSGRSGRERLLYGIQLDRTRAAPGAGTPISDIDQQLQQAEQYYSQGQLEQAEATFKAALAADPGCRQASESLVVISLQTGRREEARDILLGLIAAHPDEAIYYDRLNMVCDALGELAPSIDAYLEYLQRHPDQTTARYNLAHLLKRNGRLEEAIRQYEECLERGVDDPAEVHTNLSVIHTQRGDDNAARASLEKALDLKEDYVPALYNKAILEEETGNWEVARSLYMRVLLEQPNHVEAMVQLAAGETFTDSTNRVSRKILRALKRDGLADQQREQLYYALGKIYDDCAEYDDAMQHYARANELCRTRTTPFQPGQHEQSISELIDSSAHWLEAIEPVSDAAPLFVCGMFRSGTTLLEQVLAAHPALSAGGELDYFPRRIAALPGAYPAVDGVSADDWRGLGEGYMALLKERGLDIDTAINKRPDNFLYLGVIKALFPKARILHTVRNPLDTCLSIFFQPLDAELAYANDIKHIAEYYVQYRRLMQHWSERYAGEIMHVPYDGLVEQPKTVIGNVLEFLDLPWDDACLRFWEADTRVRTASLHQVRKPLYTTSSGRWENYAKYLEPVKHYLEAELG